MLLTLGSGLYFKNHCTTPDSFVASYQFHTPTYPNVSYDLGQLHLHDLQLQTELNAPKNTTLSYDS